MTRFFAAGAAAQELTAWIRHIEGWTDRQIQKDIQRLRAHIAHTPRHHLLSVETNQFALDRLVDVLKRRKSVRHTSQASWLAKLSPGDVRRIRRLHAEGWSQLRLAKRFRVSQSCIHNVLAGKTYKKIT